MTSNWREPILIAIFFELFWLDTFPAGTYIPPHQTFASFFTIVTANHLGLSEPGAVLPLLLLVLPLTRMMGRLEVWFRKRENVNYKKIMLQVKKRGGAFQPEHIVLGSLLRTAGMNMLVCALCLGATVTVMELIMELRPLSLPGLSWHHLLMGGLAAGLLSLRSKRVYGVLFGGAVVLTGLLFFV